MVEVVDYAGMTDVLSHSAIRDSCVVLPSLWRAVELWPKIQAMIHANQPIVRTKTSIQMTKTRTVLRLWVPFSLSPTQPFDFVHSHVFEFDYILLFGLSRPSDVKWLR